MERMGREGSSEYRRLSVIAAALETISKESEPSFLKVGNKLQTIYQGAIDLTTHTFEAVKIITGESQGGLLSKSEMLVKQSLENIKNCQATAEKNFYLAKDHACEVNEHLGKSFTLCEALKTTAKYLRVVSLQMRIECSRTSRSMEMFSVVAEEIGVLSDRFMETAEKISNDSEGAQQSQVSVEKETSESLQQLLQLSEDAEKTIQLSMNKIEQAIGLSVKTLEYAGERSRKISEHVGEIVMGIQFHDNMRQRIEHITKTFADAEKDYYEFISSCNPLGESKVPAATCVILELQKTQLENTVSEINRVYDRSTKACLEIGDEVNSLMQGLSNLENGIISLSSGQPMQQFDDPFESLRSGIQDIDRLIRHGFGLLESIHQTAKQASRAVASLSSHTETVRKLSFETRLTSINAMIKAKQLGQTGMALDRLVKEAGSVSVQSDIFVADIEKIQNLILASAGLLNSHLQEKGSSEEMQQSLNSVLNEISHGSAQFREKSHSAVKIADMLQKTLFETKSDFEFLRTLASRIDNHRQQLQEIGRALDLGSGLKTKLTYEEMEDIRKRYTIREERNVHKKFFEQTGISMETGEKDSNVNDGFVKEVMEDDGFGDNVELF